MVTSMLSNVMPQSAVIEWCQPDAEDAAADSAAPLFTIRHKTVVGSPVSPRGPAPYLNVMAKICNALSDWWN